jgi:TonB-dependent SusC/RagA subfamily outer membrane receptor
MRNGNDPLYIIDGIPFQSESLSDPNTSSSLYGPGRGVSPLNSINLSDIESIEILKDADATAIYGSRGAGT